jgi:hypothetical protein
MLPSEHFGKNNIDLAKKCFLDNYNRYGDADSAPEKFNLYKGLYALAAAVEEMKSDLAQTKAMVAQLRNRS